MEKNTEKTMEDRAGEGIGAEKKRLRAVLRERQRQLDKAYRDAASMEILTRLLSHPLFMQVGSVFTYINMEHEPESSTILDCAWQMGKTVAVPKCLSRESGEMAAVAVQGWEDLLPGTWGILEPKEGLPVVDGYKLELAIVPCLSADKEGGRLGHGLGYYDRFLGGLSIYKYCLCFDRMLSERIPMESTDIRMDRIVTESGIYNPRLAAPKAEEGSAGGLSGIWQKVRASLPPVFDFGRAAKR